MPITTTITHNGAAGEPLRLYLDSFPASVSTGGQEVNPGEVTTIQSDYPLRGSVTAAANAEWTIEVYNDLSVSSFVLRLEAQGTDISLAVTGPAGENKGTVQRPKLEPGDTAAATLNGAVYLFMIPV